jgi:general secretion pathway protein M
VSLPPFVARLGPREARLAALTGLALLITLGWHLVARPLVELDRAQRERLAVAAEQLVRLRAIGAERPRLEERLARTTELLREAALLEAAAVAPALASLQASLAEIVEDAGAKLASMAVLETGDVAGLARLALELRLQGDDEAIREVLYEIETGEPWLAIERLALLPATAAFARAAEAPPLDLRLTLVAYARIDPAGAPR